MSATLLTIIYIQNLSFTCCKIWISDNAFVNICKYFSFPKQMRSLINKGSVEKYIYGTSIILCHNRMPRQMTLSLRWPVKETLSSNHGHSWKGFEKFSIKMSSLKNNPLLKNYFSTKCSLCRLF